MTFGTDIQNRYGFHPPATPEKKAAHADIRLQFAEFEGYLSGKIPEGKYWEKVQEYLELAAVYAQKAIGATSPVDTLSFYGSSNLVEVVGLDEYDPLVDDVKSRCVVFNSSMVFLFRGNREETIEWLRNYNHLDKDRLRIREKTSNTKPEWKTVQDFLGLSTPEETAPPLLSD